MKPFAGVCGQISVLPKLAHISGGKSDSQHTTQESIREEYSSTPGSQYDCSATQRAYQREFGVRNPPKKHNTGLVNKLETTGFLVSEKDKHRLSRLPTVVVDVRARLELSPLKSVRRLPQETGYIFNMCYRGYFTTLHQHLRLFSAECDEGDNAGEMSPASNTESYPAFAHIVLRENPGKTSTSDYDSYGSGDGDRTSEFSGGDGDATDCLLVRPQLLRHLRIAGSANEALSATETTIESSRDPKDVISKLRTN
ncbi:hypothetical protein ANN_12991 [Periplaneta americana]|uniref:DUF4817 domain-containing protein n=1 Tax=Periplaneta americana TaxID=6978 RepID=A0ABQ8TK56_PERAM|nr:hypothetical protein ANN_12991 [Periplaneta americana]